MSFTAKVSNEELVDEYKAAEDDKKMDILEKLYQQNMPFIYKIAKSIAVTPEDIEDNLQDAFLILKAAADSFRPEFNNTFLTYLNVGLIRGFIKSRNQNREIPDYLALKIYKYIRLQEQFLKLYGREPTPREAEIELEISAEQYKIMLQTTKERATVSIDDIIPGSDNLTVGDTIEDPVAAADFEEIEEKLAREQTKETVWAEVNKLPDNQASTITEYYRKGKTQKEIAEERGQSINNIKQYIDRGKRNLQSNDTLKDIALEVYGIKAKAENMAYHGNLRYFNRKGRPVENAVIYLMNHGL